MNLFRHVECIKNTILYKLFPYFQIPLFTEKHQGILISYKQFDINFCRSSQ